MFTEVTLTGQVQAQPGTGVSGARVYLTLSAPISDGVVEILPQSQVATCDASGNIPAGFAVPATDDPTTVPQGVVYNVRVECAAYVREWQVVVPHAAAPSVDLFSLPVIGQSGMTLTYGVSSLNGDTGIVTIEAADSSVTVGGGDGSPITLKSNLTAPVQSVFGRAGSVVAETGDYTVSEVTGAAPLVSPAFTGTPTAPTATPLTDDTQIATTAYADAAVTAGKSASLSSPVKTWAPNTTYAANQLVVVPTGGLAYLPNGGTSGATTWPANEPPPAGEPTWTFVPGAHYIAFTSSTTYTIPAGPNHFMQRCKCGGSGGGASGTSTTTTGGPGGGGAAGQVFRGFFVPSGDTSLTITVGAGGAGGTAGAAGTNTTGGQGQEGGSSTIVGTQSGTSYGAALNASARYTNGVNGGAGGTASGGGGMGGCYGGETDYFPSSNVPSGCGGTPATNVQGPPIEDVVGGNCGGASGGLAQQLGQPLGNLGGNYPSGGSFLYGQTATQYGCGGGGAAKAAQNAAGNVGGAGGPGIVEIWF